ncbi:uncharacterized protein PV09_02043 [Verruconis gallopava]|uniref:AA1-like domain-containing protein n=1 Tax=Verruconis gallopava TaxID=253628 RepID=A0A0D2B7E5_9PEZI|nr:uncharacterized protein PV09_02043 [Verruconis gallopava]KIW07174.1 hypothetical protein PV09_02043 [Verruconis gallopava]
MRHVFAKSAALLAAALVGAVEGAALVGEDKPWQIYNLSINALPTNSTQKNVTQHITFIAVDPNVDSGLNFTANCSSFLPVGQSLFSNGYTPCNFTDAGFSLRQEGVLWFHRVYKNGEPAPWDTTICVGNTDLQNSSYYSNGPDGMTVVQDYMEIACTMMT